MKERKGMLGRVENGFEETTTEVIQRELNNKEKEETDSYPVLLLMVFVNLSDQNKMENIHTSKYLLFLFITKRFSHLHNV